MSEATRLLQTLTSQPSAVTWFKTIFRYMRVQVIDTGEEFTVTRQGDQFTVRSGFHPPERRPILFGLFDPGDWYARYFILPLQQQNLRNLVGFFQDDQLNDEELYRIMAFIQPVLLRAALNMPPMRNRLLLWLFRLDTHWHQCLLDPAGNETQPCTVQLLNGHWLITLGYQGMPQRKKTLTAAKLLAFQQRVHQAEEEDTLGGWLALNGWYHRWLDSITAR